MIQNGRPNLPDGSGIFCWLCKHFITRNEYTYLNFMHFSTRALSERQADTFMLTYVILSFATFVVLLYAFKLCVLCSFSVGLYVVRCIYMHDYSVLAPLIRVAIRHIRWTGRTTTPQVRWLKIRLVRLTSTMPRRKSQPITLSDWRKANLASTDEQKQAVFFSVIGAKSCKLIQNLVVPEKPGNLSFNDLMKIPTDHYSPAPSEIIKL